MVDFFCVLILRAKMSINYFNRQLYIAGSDLEHFTLCPWDMGILVKQMLISIVKTITFLKKSQLFSQGYEHFRNF